MSDSLRVFNFYVTSVKALQHTKAGQTPFPVQVPVKRLMNLGNMPEEEFRDILVYSASNCSLRAKCALLIFTMLTSRNASLSFQNPRRNISTLSLIRGRQTKSFTVSSTTRRCVHLRSANACCGARLDHSSLLLVGHLTALLHHTQKFRKGGQSPTRANRFDR